MKKILFAIFSTLLLISCSDELKFVCTDISLSSSYVSSRELQNQKKKNLGSEVTLQFYDNSVKVTDFDNKSVVLEKRNVDGIYEYVESERGETVRVVLTPEKWLGYIKAFTMEVYINGHLEGKVTCKRDDWFEKVVDVFD